MVNKNILVLGIILAGCGNPPIIEKRENQTIEWLQQMEKPVQYFSFLPDLQITVTGKEGTLIKIPKECFIYEDGSSVHDSIILELKECYTPSDILWNNLSTQTEHGLLETGGMVYLNANVGGKKIKVKEGKNLEIGFPRKKGAKENMKLYSGDYKDGYINWDRIISDTILNATSPADSIYTEGGTGVIYQKELDYYLFNSSMMGQWINCDKTLEGEDKTILALNIDTTIIPNLRLVFRDIKAAAFPLYENGKMIFYNIPIGQSATMLGFYKEKEKYYMYRKDIVVSPNMEETTQFKEVTSDELKQEVAGMKWSPSI